MQKPSPEVLNSVFHPSEHARTAENKAESQLGANLETQQKIYKKIRPEFVFC